MIVLLAALQTGCVLDRTGQSATYEYERQMALVQARTEEMEGTVVSSATRIDQLEEVNRYRGEQQAQELETLDQIRGEVQRLRGEMETLQHQSSLAGGERQAMDEDTAFRLAYLESRAAALEGMLGLEAPAPPSPDGAVATSPAPEAAVEGAEPPAQPTEPEVEVPTDPAEMLSAAEAHLMEGRPRVARVILARFIEDNPKHDRITEARYRYAESFFNDGDYQKAILKFEEVVANDPRSNWAPWAMVRQGECFKLLGKESEASLFWQDVVDRYPRTKAAKEAKSLLAS